MDFNFQELPAPVRYKLLVSLVVPRPIALVTSLDDQGTVNAAPFSFFNAMGSDPPLVVLGVGNREPGIGKDSALNIAATGQFVINLVDETIAEAMNVCAIDFPHGESELEAAGLTPLPSVAVRAPRIAESPVNLECREHQTLEIGNTRIIIGEVLHLHIRDELIDIEKMYVATEELHLIGRMHGRGWYARTSDLFQMPRQTYSEWQHDQHP